MSDVTIQKVAMSSDRTMPVFGEVETLLESIRRRAFDLFAGRGCGDGQALKDWLQAEREFCWPAAEFVESDKGCTLSVALPGYAPSDITVTVTPREVIVHASHMAGQKEESKRDEVCWSEFRSDDVYRRLELSADIDVNSVTASLKNGILKIAAKKLVVVLKKIPVAVAA